VVERVAAEAEPHQPECPAPDEHGEATFSQEAGEPGNESAKAVAAAVFDLEAAVRTCYGEDDLFREMVGSLCDDAEPWLKRMRSALARGDCTEIAHAAHQLRGTVVYLAAPHAADATGRLEQIAKSGDLDRAAFAIEQVEHEIGRLMQALAPYRRIGVTQTE